MDKQDAGQFEQTLNLVLETKGRKPVSGQALALWWNAFKDHSLVDVRSALSEAMLSSAFFEPGLVADILEKNGAGDGHLDGDEAWAIALNSFDESATVVMTDEIAGALQVARDIYLDGDRTGARMAFRSAYEKKVDQARREGKQAKWWPSLGHDPSARASALEQAVIEGKLLPESVNQFLPAPITQEGSALLGSVLKQLEGKR